MRLAGVVLLLLGLVAAVVGTFSGCGSLFTWNGRHAIDVRPIPEAPMTEPLIPKAGRRYTVSVQVVFEREGLPKRDGVVLVEAKMPIVLRVKDAAGTTLTELTGWIDPNDPPNVLYGQAAHETMRGPMPELVVERLAAPFTAASAAPLSVEVILGPDRVGSAAVLARRLVIHDDALPPAIRSAFVIASVGGLGAVSGVVLLVIGWYRGRRSGKSARRGGAR